MVPVLTPDTPSDDCPQAESSPADQQQIEEYREAFSLLDRDGDGRLDNGDLGTFLRALGRMPTEAQVRALASPSGSLSFPDCLTLLAQMPVPDVATLRRDLLAAFHVFDREGKGTISAAELRHIVTSLGERLSEEEADAMLKQADPQATGVVEYAKFIDTLLAA